MSAANSPAVETSLTKPAIRSFPDPLRVTDATVISVYPFEVKAAKPGMVPPEFTIPAAPKDDISILNVPFCDVYIYIDSDRGQMAMKEFAGTVARSIVQDYVTSQFCYNGENCQPGLFWVPGRYTKEEIKELFAEEIKKARNAQQEWFKRLVMDADDSWNKTKRHSNISEMQRVAVRQLGIKRDWVIDYVSF